METDQYLDMFIDESKEHIMAMSDHLLAFEQDPMDMDTVAELFRSAHTLKGMAATMGFEDLASLTHHMEDVLDAIRHQKLNVHEDMVDLMFQSVDEMESMLVSITQGKSEEHDVSHIIQELSAILSGKPVYDEPLSPRRSSAENILSDPASATEQPSDTRLELDEFEKTVVQQASEGGLKAYALQIQLTRDCVMKAARAYMVFELLEKEGEILKAVPDVEEIENEAFQDRFELLLISTESAEHIQEVILKVSEVEHVFVNECSPQMYRTSQSVTATSGQEKNMNEAAAQREPQASNNQSYKQSKSSDPSQKLANKTIRVNIERLDSLMNLFSEMVIDRGRLQQIAHDLQHDELEETVEHMTRLSEDLQDLILNMRMVPIETVFNRFPRMVRSLSKELNKKIDLQIEGADTELDRTVIDEIGDPLVHLLRNALDHGIESPQIREQLGKPEQGIIRLKAYHSGNHVFIEIEDDGGGIERNKILQKAVEGGLISEEKGQELADQDVYQLMFSPGFSTADTISDVSGRGVGLDVVANKIQSLGGIITINSQEKAGTKFSIQLPLSLSIVSAMLVHVGQEKYAVPLSSIMETALLKADGIQTVHNQKVIQSRGNVIPLISLHDLYDIPQEKDEQELTSVLIVRKGEKMAGFIVDSFIGQQEVVLKSLGPYLSDVFSISGATILGDGQVALIIDPNAIL